MLLSEFRYVIFIGFIISLLCVFKKNVYRKCIILVASFVFYAYWDVRFLLLILVPVFVDFFCGKAMYQPDTKANRKIYLWISLFVNLVILCVFKYLNFFIDAFQPVFHGLNWDVRTLDIILPVGVSFFTFKSLTYTIDAYFRRATAAKSLLDYAVYLCFFPTLLAGPIVRSANFLPQLNTRQRIGGEAIASGFRLFVIGLFKKVYIADNLAIFINAYYEGPGLYDSATAWLAIIAYSLQIYFDFSGYSDMAIGSARAMGYKIEKNFDFPYLSRNFIEFWRRWHITLSTWIRDYLYIPLGGSRKGRIRTYINLLAAMTICGLWHGAAWTFVFWGFYHGVCLVINRMQRGRSDSSRFRLPDGLKIIFTFLVVSLGWVFFRSPDFGTAFAVLMRLFSFSPEISWIPPFVVFIISATVIFHIVYFKFKAQALLLPMTRWYTPTLLLTLVWLVIMFYPKTFTPFIYIQF